MIKENSLILAPMAELSHTALRILIEELGGCDYYFSEMISAKAFLNKTKYEKSYISTKPSPQKTILQLVSGDKNALISAAEKLDKCSDAFGIDINMGCPAPEIRKQNGGVSWMHDIKRAEELLSELRKVVNRKTLSVKIRLGKNEDNQFLIDFVKMIKSSGIDFITIHGRTEKEKLKRVSRWKYFDFLKDLEIPIIGNGDITTFTKYLKMKKTYAPYGIMIGRKAVSSPWFFDYIRKKEKNPNLNYKVNLQAILNRFIVLLKEELPKEFLYSRFKRFALYFSENLFYGHHFYVKIQNSSSFEEASDHALNYFYKHPDEIEKNEKI